jgi:hypothetical protein
MKGTNQMFVLKRFLYSIDGKTPLEANVGPCPTNIPEELGPGLLAEGFIGHEPLEVMANLTGAPETSAPSGGAKIVEKELDADEMDLIMLRAKYFEATGSEVDKRWSAATLREKLIEA